MRWRMLAVLVTALLAGPQLAQAQSIIAQSMPAQGAVERVEIIQFGTYQTGKTGKTVPNADSANGRVTFVGNHKLLERTDTICARLQTTFGVEFKLVGAPAGRTVTLNMVTRFPPGGVTNAQAVTFTHNKFKSGQIIGDSDFRSFTFDEPYELVAGPWVLEFHYQDQLIGTKIFTVRHCEPVS
jgi:Domain of unknown function (DUF3859)